MKQIKKAFEDGFITLSEYQTLLNQEIFDLEMLINKMKAEYNTAMRLKTYYCVSYTVNNDRSIQDVYVSCIENAYEPPANSYQEREEYAVYNEWYDDTKYVFEYINKLTGYVQ